MSIDDSKLSGGLKCRDCVNYSAVTVACLYLGAFNAERVVQLRPETQAIIANAGTPIP